MTTIFDFKIIYTGVDGKLFTGVLYNGYDPPPYLCWRKDHFEETVRKTNYEENFGIPLIV